LPFLVSPPFSFCPCHFDILRLSDLHIPSPRPTPCQIDFRTPQPPTLLPPLKSPPLPPLNRSTTPQSPFPILANLPSPSTVPPDCHFPSPLFYPPLGESRQVSGVSGVFIRSVRIRYVLFKALLCGVVSRVLRFGLSRVVMAAGRSQCLVFNWLFPRFPTPWCWRGVSGCESITRASGFQRKNVWSSTAVLGKPKYPFLTTSHRRVPPVPSSPSSILPPCRNAVNHFPPNRPESHNALLFFTGFRVYNDSF